MKIHSKNKEQTLKNIGRLFLQSDYSIYFHAMSTSFFCTNTKKNMHLIACFKWLFVQKDYIYTFPMCYLNLLTEKAKR